MVEFALIAAPFFLLLGGIIEMAFLMLATNALQSSVQLVGQGLTDGGIPTSASAVRSAMCARLPGMMDCQGALVIDVRTVHDWSQFAVARRVDEVFPMDAATSDLYIRATYTWPMIFPSSALGLDMTDESGSYLLAATTVIR